MEILILFIAAPVLIFLGLALLPYGRPAVIGCAAVVLGAILVWVLPGDNSILVALSPMAIGSVVLAGGVQILRKRLNQTQVRHGYLLFVGLTAIGLGFLIVRLLGI